MSQVATAHILGWSFAPLGLLEGLSSYSELAHLSSEGVNVDFMPMALRRRCSTFSKVTLAVAHAAMSRTSTSAQPRTIFASQHGESTITKDLLNELARDQQLSPMGFSLSVHNAASGLYSIATGNKAPATAIAAGEETFFMGLSEAFLALTLGETSSSLLVCSDDVVPQDFLPTDSQKNVPFALAIAFSSEASPDSVSMTVERRVEDVESAAMDGGFSPAIKVARWMRQGGDALSVPMRGTRWTLSLAAHDALHLFKNAYA
jgi:hypothetical protein